MDIGKSEFIYAVSACFIDYGKAVDVVQRKNLIKSHKEGGLEDRVLKIIADLYSNENWSIVWESSNEESWRMPGYCRHAGRPARIIKSNCTK